MSILVFRTIGGVSQSEVNTLVGVMFFLYLSCVGLFLVSTHCVFYCVLLVASCIFASGVVYLILGFSWYSLLMCLVYVGGVYILFVFVSVQSPNTTNPVGVSRLTLCSLLISVVYLCQAALSGGFGVVEASTMLCTSAEGPFYICLCFALLFGFTVISMVMSVKPSFYR